MWFRPYGLTDKRWAQRAAALQFQELESVRAVAQQWRTGLTGLTALLSVASIVVFAVTWADRRPEASRCRSASPASCGIITAGIDAGAPSVP